MPRKRLYRKINTAIFQKTLPLFVKETHSLAVILNCVKPLMMETSNLSKDLREYHEILKMRKTLKLLNQEQYRSWFGRYNHLLDSFKLFNTIRVLVHLWRRAGSMMAYGFKLTA